MSDAIPQIQVIDNSSQQILYSCSLEDSSKAYAYAAELETMGLDISVLTPTLSDTLSASLGLNKSQIDDYKESMQEEIEQHDGSCCFKNDSKI